MQRTIFDEEHEMFRECVLNFMINEVQPHKDRRHELGIVDREIIVRSIGLDPRRKAS